MKATMIVVLLILAVVYASRIRGASIPNKYDHYLLSCGSTSVSEVSSFDGRDWSTDQNTTFSSLYSLSISSTVAAVSPINSDNLTLESPFSRARIFKSNFTYTFPVSPGPKFLRLFFYPAVYTDDFDASFNASHFFISVQANNHLLLRNFSAGLAVNYAPYTVRLNTSTDVFVIKEYYVSVPRGETSLNVTFSPTSDYAFVNGIELVSVPDGLYVMEYPVMNVVSPSNPFQISTSTAFETLYRLNVGGNEVGMKTDGLISGMYRLWKNDDPYTFLMYGQPGMTTISINYTEQVPKYTAPELVYRTARQLGYGDVENTKVNLTWRLKVDPGFYYMVRLHWCELDFHVNSTNQRIFDVYINNLTAESPADVMAWTGDQRYVPIYHDYVVFVTGNNGDNGRVDLWIALHPNTEFSPLYNEVLLNGLEIFKINRVDGSLDAPNPHVHYQVPSKLPTKPPEGPKRSKVHHRAIIARAIGATLLTSLVLLACIIVMFSLKQKSESITNQTSHLIPSFELGTNTSGPSTSSHVCLRFSLSQIKLATNYFSEALIIGHGGFGNVYRATLDREKGCLMEVAIKRLNPSSKQGAQEFMTEIQMLSKIRHVHLVSLIGYCDESGEMILVYDYMEHGTLRDHLCDTTNPPLSWNLRLNICLGAAKGLHYLHAGVGHMIIHRDVKSTNILLDENWVPKVSDFGLSKMGPIGGDLHVSTAVKGSFGYVDPQYYMLQQLTEKSDVYSFGVVLFEVLCGRAALNPNLPSEQVNLAMWARSCQQRGEVDVIVDPSIKGEIAPECLRKFGEIAERCVREHRMERPSMVDVVWSLELALELQQHNIMFVSDDELPLTISQLTSFDKSEQSLPSALNSTSHGECMTN